MKRSIARALAALLATTTLAASPALAKPPAGPPPAYQYWEGRRAPPPGHEVRPAPPTGGAWDRRSGPPPNWGQREWDVRQRWLRTHGHDRYDHDSAVGLVAGTILGFVLGAAIADSKERQAAADARLNDPAWIAYCARKYASFDPYSGTYLGSDGLRHYCQ
jgi:hypothetical protein